MAQRCRWPSTQWLLVLGSALCFLAADGVTYSFGFFFAALMDAYGEQHSASTVALLSGLLYGLPQISGPLVCPLVTALGSPAAAGLGAGLVTLALAAGSQLPFSGLLTAVGLGASVGLELLYATALSVVLCNFRRRRGLATGATVFGGGVGALLFAELLPALERRYAWRGAMLVEAALVLHAAPAACLYFVLREVPPEEEEEEKKTKEKQQSVPLSKLLTPGDGGDAPNPNPISTRAARSLEELWMASQASGEFTEEERMALNGPPTPMGTSKGSRPELVLDIDSVSNPNLFEVDSTHGRTPACCSGLADLPRSLADSFRALGDPSLWSGAFLAFCLLNLLIGAAILQPWVFVFRHATALDVSPADASHLLSAMGIAYAAGQVAAGALADSLNAYVLYGLSLLLSGAACLLMGVVASLGGLLALSALFGVAMGGTMALYGLVLVEMVGEERFVAALGVYLPFVGAGNLVGAPLGAWLATAFSYEALFVVAGATMMGLALLFASLCVRPVRKFGLRPLRVKKG